MTQPSDEEIRTFLEIVNSTNVEEAKQILSSTSSFEEAINLYLSIHEGTQNDNHLDGEHTDNHFEQPNSFNQHNQFNNSQNFYQQHQQFVPLPLV
jgi:hypothetical protein